MLLHLTLPMNHFLWSCTNRIKINLLKLNPEVRVKIHWGRTLLVTVFSFRKAKSIFYGFSFSSEVLFQISLIMVVDTTDNFTVSNFFLSYDLELFVILHLFSLWPERALSPARLGIFVFRRTDTDSPSGNPWSSYTVHNGNKWKFENYLHSLGTSLYHMHAWKVKLNCLTEWIHKQTTIDQLLHGETIWKWCLRLSGRFQCSI